MNSTTETRRLTPTERLHEVTMAFAQRTPTPPEHAVEITRNAKGVAQFQVTVRGFELEAVVAEALAQFEALGRALPYPLDAS